MITSAPSATRLPLQFDVSELVQELGAIEMWIEHVNKRDYEGQWSVAPLTAPEGAIHPIQQVSANPGGVPHVPTAFLERSACFRALLAALDCPLLGARLLRLGPGARILEHDDPGLSLRDGQVRLHVPLITHEDVVFTVDGMEIPMRTGELWYLDATRPHAVHNRSPIERVHLVVDCRANDWLRRLVDNGESCVRPPPPSPPTPARRGELGVYALHAIWSRAQASRTGHQEADPDAFTRDRTALFVLGLGLEETLTHLYMDAPDYPDFERWVVDKAGRPDRKTVERLNAISTQSAYPDDVQAELDAIDALQPVLSEDDLALWRQQGFLVVPNAAPQAQISAAADAVWRSAQARPDARDTWYRHPQIMQPEVHAPAFTPIRSSLRVRKAFAQLWGTADLVPSVDRCSFHPPQRAGHPFPGPDLHWDVDFSSEVGFGTQGLVYLSDTPAEQGALTLVPGFHERLSSWLAALPAGRSPQDMDLHALGSRAVAGRAGDLVIWDQRLPHGARPNLGESPRLVLYLNLGPARVRTT